MTRIIHVLGHSGSGKSVLAFNLGVALAAHHDVVMVDGNLTSPDLSSYANLSAQAYLNDYLDGAVSLEDTIHEHPSGMRIIPSQAEEHSDRTQQITKALLHLMGKADIVLVDSLAQHHTLVDHTDESIIVSNDDYHNIAKNKDFIAEMEKRGVSPLGVVLNRRGKTPLGQIESILGKRVLAEIKHDESLIESINNRQPVVLSRPKSSLSKAAQSIASSLSLGEND